MSRYSGEEYTVQVPCAGGKHDWAMNGCCWSCGHYRDDLLSAARALIAVEEGPPPRPKMHPDGAR